MAATRLPTNADELTLQQLNAVLAQQSPAVALTDYTVTEMNLWGEGQASSAGRLTIEPTYADPPRPDLPRHMVVKVARTDPQSDDPTIVRGSGALYRNEVDVYRKLRPQALVEAPAVFGAVFDPETSTFLLLMEDLRDRDAQFGSVTVPLSQAILRSILDQLAMVHARYWSSDELASELSWMETHTRGDLHFLFSTPQIAPAFIAEQVQTVQFKREIVQHLGTTLDELYDGFQSVQRHQARLPQTVCHGDTHIGNTYVLPDGRAGLLDWQLCSQGYALHDVSYLIATALSVADRRAHERELIAYYREKLLEHGVTEPPSAEEMWLEYRRAMVWGLYIGWLITPVVNYGWEINVMNHIRLASAFEDLETGTLLRQMR